MSVEDIPQELKKLNQWVCVYGDSKIPMTALSNGAASSTDWRTWSSFRDACDSVKMGMHDNIGFVFADNGIVGIDIDDGVDEDGFMTPLAADIISRCRSYTERSRSGRGFHILLRGKLPFKGKNNLTGVEIYKSSRYFIMTGNTFLFDEVREDQEAIDYVVSTYFPETRREGKENSRSQKVYHPRWKCWKGKRIPVKPEYPTIREGGRNLCLASLAGMLHTAGYDKGYIYSELVRCNREACVPPVDRNEIRTIVNSITRYSR